MKKTFVILSIIFVSFLFQSCGAPTYISSWRSPNYKGGKLKKILVFAIVKDVIFRSAYEKKLSSDMKAVGVTGVSSLKLIDYGSKITENEIKEIVDDGNFDGVLTLKYTKVKTTKFIVPGETFYNDYWRGVEVIRTPGYVEIHKNVFMQSKLFSVKENKVIWVGQTETINARSANDLATSLSKEITNNLIEEGIIK